MSVQLRQSSRWQIRQGERCQVRCRLVWIHSTKEKPLHLDILTPIPPPGSTILPISSTRGTLSRLTGELAMSLFVCLFVCVLYCSQRATNLSGIYYTLLFVCLFVLYCLPLFLLGSNSSGSCRIRQQQGRDMKKRKQRCLFWLQKNDDHCLFWCSRVRPPLCFHQPRCNATQTDHRKIKQVFSTAENNGNSRFVAKEQIELAKKKLKHFCSSHDLRLIVNVKRTLKCYLGAYVSESMHPGRKIVCKFERTSGNERESET